MTPEEKAKFEALAKHLEEDTEFSESFKKNSLPLGSLRNGNASLAWGALLIALGFGVIFLSLTIFGGHAPMFQIIGGVAGFFLTIWGAWKLPFLRDKGTASPASQRAPHQKSAYMQKLEREWDDRMKGGQ